MGPGCLNNRAEFPRSSYLADMSHPTAVLRMIQTSFALCHKQEDADMCQACDDAKPYTGSVQTTSAAGCWDEDFRSDIDMVISGT